MKGQVLSASGAASASAAQLVAALDALGVHFLHGGQAAALECSLEPTHLIRALATSSEARLRLALIPLFLRHPSFARYAALTYPHLPAAAQLLLACYYTAALLLQQKHQLALERLWGSQAPLPDLFSQRLALVLPDDPDQALATLAVRQAQLSGSLLNWRGTYEHAAHRCLAHWEKQQYWEQQPWRQ